MSRVEINVGMVLALSPEADPAAIRGFAERLVADAEPELENASGVAWRFHSEEPYRLRGDDSRPPADFLDEATLRMVEGPYDMVLVITDVGLVSRKQRVVAGLASPVSHVAVLSTRKLLISPRGEPVRRLEDDAVRRNAAALLLHLIGHMLGLEAEREADAVMRPFTFHDEREVPRFSSPARRLLARRAAGFPEREHRGQGVAGVFWFHLVSSLRHPALVLKPLLRSRALLLPLALPGLATAAVAPSLILVFTAEIWDVGLNLPEREAWTFASLSILAATWYLVQVQNLFFPHKEKRLITEHMAVVNTTILLTMLLAMIGLFLMVALLMLAIELYIFPPGLIATWPTLQDPQVTLRDRFILAAFISSVGVLTGALAGGLESRAVIRHLALFRDRA